jgi:hypothetical protein
MGPLLDKGRDSSERGLFVAIFLLAVALGTLPLVSLLVPYVRLLRDQTAASELLG